MFKRQTSGSVVCPSCGKLVGVKDARCYNCGRPYPGMFGFTALLRGMGQDLGFVQLVTFVCAGLYLASLALDPSQLFGGGLFNLLAPTGKSLFLLGASGALPVFHFDRWWTVLSAAWLHGSLLHIVFNLMWVRQLGSLTADVYGAGRMVIIYTVSSITGFAMTSVAFFLPMPAFLHGAGLSVGASAPLFGLLGALIFYGQRGRNAAMNQQIKYWALLLFLFGFVLARVDNWAHIGGFLGGYLASRFLNPLKPERTDHLIAGVVCIVLSLLSIVVSVLHGLRFMDQL